MLGDWSRQDRALRAFEATKAGKGTEDQAEADEAWLTNDLPKVLTELNRLGIAGAGQEVLDLVVRSYRVLRDAQDGDAEVLQRH